jgi:hypothetical protein
MTTLVGLIQLTMARIVNKQIVLLVQLPAQGAERRKNLIAIGVEEQSGLKAISLIEDVRHGCRIIDGHTGNHLTF